jgi:putative transposase
VKYAFIARHRDEYPVRLMCRVFELAPSGYYAWRKGCSPTAHALADERLMLNIRVAHRASGGKYGSPRIHRELRDEGIRVGKKRVARLMRESGLVGRARRRWVRTTDSNHAYPIAPNLLNRQFTVRGPGALTQLNRVWVSDITYIPTSEGWLYLAVVLDLASRRVIGWSMREQLDAQLSISALHMAIERRQPRAGLIHHSDRGVQYACSEYRAALAAHGIEASMSRIGDCWDNAVAESFFATLELELIADSRWRTRAAARNTILWFIEAWYNSKRRHSTLDYVNPVEYERRLLAA